MAVGTQPDILNTCCPESCCLMQVRASQLVMLLDIQTIEAWVLKHTPAPELHCLLLQQVVVFEQAGCPYCKA